MKSLINFDEDLAAIHGYLCSDGYLCKKSKKNRWWILGLRNTNAILLKDYQKRVKRYFGFKPSITDGRCSFTRKSVWLFLVKYFNSFHSYEWTFPDNMPIEHYWIWLRAFFDCEATVKKVKGKDRSISLECVNKKGTRSLYKALKKLGISSKLSKRRTRNTFLLCIYGKANIIKYRKEIGFLHPKKKSRLNEAIKSFINYYWVFPKEETLLKTFVKQKMQEKSRIGKNGSIRFCSNKKSNLTKLSKYLNRYFEIISKVSNARYNSRKILYFELSINKKSEISKALKNNLVLKHIN